MASSYAETHQGQIAVLVLLAAYPAQEANLPMIAIYGSEDRVLNREKLTVVKNVVQIPGGNHAGFGNYGDQAGDGQATISREAQQGFCVEMACGFMGV